MYIRELRAYGGRNIHSHYPAVEMLLDLGDLDGRKTRDLGDFSERLLEALPGLAQHHCSLGRPGGFVERMREGTYLGHVVEHVALELQTQAGLAMAYGKTRRTLEPGIYRIVFEYKSKEAGLEAARQAVALVDALLGGEKRDSRPIIDQLNEVAARTELGPSTAAIAEAAKRRGIPVTRVGPESLLRLGHGRRQRWVRATITSATGSVAVDIAGDKSLTKLILSQAGIPVPPGALARTAEEAIAVAGLIAAPTVIKPRDGNQGRGVSLNLKTEADVEAAFNVARAYGDEVIVEKHVPGRHYRLLVVGGRLVAAAERLPARVTGDGVHTVAELVTMVNADPNRGEEHEKPLTKIKIDQVVLNTLAKEGLDLTFRPSSSQVVNLREGANLSTGGTAHDVTDQVHPDFAALAVRTALVVRLDVAGIDLVTPDITGPFDAERTAVIEVNAAPGFRMHLYPSEGKPRPVGEAIVDSLFPPGDDGRIPIVAVTGTNGKTTVCRIIARFLEAQGTCVGLAATDGISIGGKLLVKGDTSGAWSADLVLGDPEVEAAVLETARGGIIRSGLAFDHCDVAVVTNISADHIGQDGIETIEDLADVKALLVEAVPKDGFAVLNADDPYVLEMAGRTDGQVIFFGMQDDNLVIRKHLALGGRAVVVRKGRVLLAQGSSWSRLGRVSEFPLTIDGKVIHNLQNILAAAAAGWAAGVKPEVMVQVLREFTCAPGCNPGRFNIYQVGQLRLVVDYGHNPAAFRSTLRAIKAQGPGRPVGVITAPGDRRDEDIIELGRIAGRGFIKIIVKEDHDKRGRRDGEVAELLRRGVLEAGAALDTVTVILDESEAVLSACRAAQDGDVVVVFYEKYDLIDQLARTVVAEWQERQAAPRVLVVAGSMVEKSLTGGPGN
ncbi:MAG TPA: cyanophycin synthetase [Bacillota bacterium]|jgi:cyanophycin synthetase